MPAKTGASNGLQIRFKKSSTENTSFLWEDVLIVSQAPFRPGDGSGAGFLYNGGKGSCFQKEGAGYGQSGADAAAAGGGGGE